MRDVVEPLESVKRELGDGSRFSAMHPKKLSNKELREFIKPMFMPGHSFRLWIRLEVVASFIGCSEEELFNRMLDSPKKLLIDFQVSDEEELIES